MYITINLALLATVGLDYALAQPHRHHHHKHRGLDQVDWNDAKNYEGVDWNTVNYGGQPATTTPAPQPTTTSASSEVSVTSAPDAPKPKADEPKPKADAPKPQDASPKPKDTSSSGSGDKKFGGRTDPVDNGNKDEYKGNVGIPYGSNMIQLASVDDIKNFKYSNTFENGGSDKISVVVWNKVGSDGQCQSGMALPAHLKFDLDAGQSIAVAFDENSQIGFAKDGQRNQYGMLTTAWGEADYGDLRNQGWSGYDRSTIVQGGNEGLLTISCEGAKTSSQQGNSFLSASQTNAGGALPPGEAHLKTTIG